MKYEFEIVKTINGRIRVEAASESEARCSAFDIIEQGVNLDLVEFSDAKRPRRPFKPGRPEPADFVSFPEMVRRIRHIQPNTLRWGVVASLLRRVVLYAVQNPGWDMKTAALRCIKRRYRSISRIETDMFENRMYAFQDDKSGWDKAYTMLWKEFERKPSVASLRQTFSVETYGLVFPVDHSDTVFMANILKGIGKNVYRIDTPTTIRAAALAAFLLMMRGVLKPELTTDEDMLKELKCGSVN